jgi:response regulator receiver domain-containing protein
VRNWIPRFFVQCGAGELVPIDLEIAVIDDDESFRVALVESLSSFGYGVHGYASAEDYLRGGGSKSYDCVVTDIHMPGMSGLDLMKRLAAQGYFDHGAFGYQPRSEGRRCGGRVSAQKALRDKRVDLVHRRGGPEIDVNLIRLWVRSSQARFVGRMANTVGF